MRPVARQRVNGTSAPRALLKPLRAAHIYFNTDEGTGRRLRLVRMGWEQMSVVEYNR